MTLQYHAESFPAQQTLCAPPSHHPLPAKPCHGCLGTASVVSAFSSVTLPQVAFQVTGSRGYSLGLLTPVPAPSSPSEGLVTLSIIAQVSEWPADPRLSFLLGTALPHWTFLAGLGADRSICPGVHPSFSCPSVFPARMSVP